MKFVVTKDMELFVIEGIEDDEPIGQNETFYEEEEYDVDLCTETETHYHIQFGCGAVTDVPKDCVDVIEKE